ncbi:hypothetical protein [Salmonella phage SD-1_S14]|nr:hypothetical protein [Salmonella phage SD-2_S15]WPK19979.1 hypothetical protein [Salmonella phage SD-1_S14]
MKVIINPAGNFFGEVFGADCIVQNFPRIEIDGIDVQQYGNLYYVVDETGSIVHDSAFFTKEEMQHLIVLDT